MREKRRFESKVTECAGTFTQLRYAMNYLIVDSNFGHTNVASANIRIAECKRAGKMHAHAAFVREHVEEEALGGGGEGFRAGKQLGGDNWWRMRFGRMSNTFGGKDAGQ